MTTESVWLPTDEELNHKELPVSSYLLRASAMHLGKYCDLQSKEYMLCKSEERDPRKCLGYGQAVTECGLDFYKKVKKVCRPELEWYTKCLDFKCQGADVEYVDCRKEQAFYDTCMQNNGFERAPFGHFQKIRVHDSDRPKPKPWVPMFPDAVPTRQVTIEPAQNEIPVGGQRKQLWFTGIGRPGA